jgi:hypothetical protein
MLRNEGINPNNILPGRRTAVASSRVTSNLNDAQPELGSHRKAAEAARASAIQDADVEYDSSAPPSRRGSSPPRSASEPDFEMNMPGVYTPVAYSMLILILYQTETMKMRMLLLGAPVCSLEP